MKEKVSKQPKFTNLGYILHLIGFLHFSFGTYYNIAYVHIPEELFYIEHNVKYQNMTTDFGGKFQYLTIINLICLILYFLVALINDTFGTNEFLPEKTPVIRKIKDYIFSTFAFPITFLIGITFWSIYAFDRELVFPKALDIVTPSWMNHFMHSSIMIFMILDLILTYRKYPRRKCGIIGISFYIILYLVWIHIIKFKTDVWIYPILDVLNLPLRMVFFAICILFSILLYFTGDYINDKIWRNKIKALQDIQEMEIETLRAVEIDM